MPFARKPAVEWMDDDLGTPKEVHEALRTISFVNRRFGGNRVHRQLLERAATGRQELEVLEVAAGQAGPLAYAALALQRRGITVRPVLLDRKASHFPPAGSWPGGLGEPKTMEADALHIPLPDGSVDVVSCCLFLHHLPLEDAAAFLREGLRVARVAVLINDLERTRLHYGLARLFSVVDPSRISRHDGPTSVRQAYSYAEMQAMLRATGRSFLLERRFLQRLAAVVWVK